jgi:Tol biopolymer transport system component
MQAATGCRSGQPDGKSIVFRSNRSKYFKLYEKASDGSGSETLLLDKTSNTPSPKTAAFC